MKLDSRCQTCGCEGESIQHVLFSCSFPRQVWAMSNIPVPLLGLECGSVYANLYHFLINRDNLKWPVELRRSFPWIIWRIWKNRNLFFFEGKRFTALETILKVRKDVEDWFAAQVVEKERRAEVGQSDQQVFSPRNVSPVVRWLPPPSDWVKCNVGLSWSRRNSLAGVAWVLRNDRGNVLMHSRRAFSNISSFLEAQFLSIVWAVEGMVSHHVNRVVFGVEAAVLVGVLNRPHAWPSFRFQSSEILLALNGIAVWKVVLESVSSNRGANLIAQSVTKECRLQSYVAVSFPAWLLGVFRDERVLTSVD
ncbi:unnamed protein product [Arabidopsis thaliana]|uniref:(thale cress) hypothetical protein n=1 Tax=Arabidopsis thaliana TaxID=3702 RepID=A0A7G2F2H8_ARATH|nr:unnamed protein product [Arabidopsis thaliana]